MADRTFFTTIARQVADAASDIESISSGASSAPRSGSGSGSVSSVVSGSRPASVTSSIPSGPPQTQALLGSPGQIAAQAPAELPAQQVRFNSVSPPRSAQGSQHSASDGGSGSGSIVSGATDAMEAPAEGTDVRRMLLHLCIPAAVFAAVYNVGPLIAHEKLTDKKGLVDKRKLLMASGLAAGVAFVIARLVI